MNVLENIMIGAFLRNPGRKEAEAKAKEVAEIFGFMEKLSLKAVSLTISEQSGWKSPESLQRDRKSCCWTR